MSFDRHDDAEVNNEFAALRQRYAELEQQLAERTAERDLFRGLLDRLPDGLSISGLDGTVLYTNSAYQELTGYKDEIIGTAVMDLYDQSPESITSIIDQVTGQGGWSGVLTHKRSDGSTFAEQVSAFNLDDHQDHLQAMAVMVRDVSESFEMIAALRESEERYRLLSEHSRDLICLHDVDGRYRYISQAVFELLGYTPDELLGTSPYALFHPQDCERIMRESHEKAKRGELENRIEYRIRHKDGTYIWFETSTRPIVDEHGQISALQTASRNITKRKQIEEDLRKLQLAVEQSPSSIVITNIDGAIEYVNPQFTRLTGYTFEEVYGQNPSILKSKETPRSTYQELWSTILSGYEWHGEFCNRKKNGELFWELSSISPILNDDGKITHFVAVKEDITKRKQAEEALHALNAELERRVATRTTELLAANQRLQFHIENSPLAVIEWDRDFCLSFWSPQAERMFGWKAEEVLGKHPYEWQFVVEEDQESTSDIITRLRSGSEVSNIHINRNYRRDGSIIWCQWYNSALFDETGELISIFVMGQDITEQRQAETVLRRSEERLRHIVRHMPVLLDAFDEHGTIIVWNEECERVTGYRADEMIGNARAMELLYPDPEYREQVMTAWSKKGHNYRDWEWSLTAKDGTQKIIAWSNISKFFPIPGWAAWGIGVDVTQRTQAEEALRERERTLATLMSNLPGMAYRCRNDELWTMEFVSEGCTELTGYLTSSLIENRVLPYIDLIHPDDRQPLWDEIQAAVQKQQPFRLTYRIQTAAGEEKWVLEQGCGIFSSDGTSPVLEGFIMDITEQRHAEEALRERERILQETQRIGQIGGWELDLLNDTLHWTEQTYRIHEVADDFQTIAIMDNPQQFYPPEALAEMAPAFERLLTEGIPFDLEVPFVTATGNHLWVRTIGKVRQERDGRVVKVAGIFQDITRRKQAQHEMQRQTARAEALVHIAARLNVQLDLNAVLHTVCEATAEALHIPGATFGLYDSHHDALFYRVAVGIPPHLVRQIKPQPRSVVEAQTQELGTVRVIPDIQVGTGVINEQLARQINARTTAQINVMRGDELVGVLIAFTVGEVRTFTADELALMQGIADQVALAVTNARLFEELHQERVSLARRITERTTELSIANAELERALRAKDEFLANMSHELRTPLNSILGQSEALQEEIYGPLTTRQRTSIQAVEESGRHLLTLINDILDLAKIEAGREELAMEIVAIDEVCQASLRMIRQTAQKKSLVVSDRIDHTIPFIQADGRRLKQILVNLLSNAVKFTPKGGKIGLDVSTDVENQVVRFAVWDTGIGIAPQHMDRLFKPFVQVEGGLNRPHEGTGLGLSLVMRLAELHGGSVSVESEVRKGSRFTVSLPFSGTTLLSEESQPLSTELSEVEMEPLSKLQRAFIIEDSLSAADQITRYLGELGIHSVIAIQGSDAVNQAAEIRPDIIILDILLPDTSGWEVLQALKNDSRTASIPVLIISVVDDKEQGMALGAAEYLVKPITRQQLQTALHTVLSHQPPDTPTAFVVVPEPTTSVTTPLILLAEDNEQSIEMISDYIQMKGYRVVVARNGIEAIEHANETLPDLILMDIQMPKMDGLEATRRIRESAALETIPIIALTALAMPGDRERCIEAGANDYLSKPISLKQLMQLIQEYL